MFNEKEAFALFEKQQECWPEFKERVSQLKQIRTKKFVLEDSIVIAQVNPLRAISSNAKVDEKSIKERKCFLCDQNRPIQQIGVAIIKDFTLLVNPFPILKGHFTIPCNNHCRQEIRPFFSKMLEIARLMPKFQIFYNGPKCGASAPDHMHFQAVLKGQLPFILGSSTKKVIKETTDASIKSTLGSGRNCILIESKNENVAKNLFFDFYENKSTNEEPMMNIFADFDNATQVYSIYIFRRKAHRPSMYYSKKDFWMISPGAIDMAGILVLPRLEDFDRINTDIIKDVYNQVSL